MRLNDARRVLPAMRSLFGTATSRAEFKPARDFGQSGDGWVVLWPDGPTGWAFQFVEQMPELPPWLHVEAVAEGQLGVFEG